MIYNVKEIFYSLQGEGGRSGRGSVFCRFAGCNLWSGRESDRAAAQCRFCDTDFVGFDGERGGRYRTAQQLAETIFACWKARTHDRAHQYVVFTGGEPLLQLDADLIAAVKELGFEVAVESNGTLDVPPGIDWLCISPKAGTKTLQRKGQELKFVYPQEDFHPEDVAHWAFERFFLQPMDGPSGAENLRAATEYCLKNPQWRLSLQTHKLIGLP